MEDLSDPAIEGDIESEPPTYDEEIVSLFSQLKYFIFDLDGVLWNSNKIIEGSSEMIEALLNMKKQVFFISNSSLFNRQQVIHNLQKSGFPADESNVISSSYAAAHYLKSIHHKGPVYCVGTESGLGKELVEMGIRHRSFTPNIDLKELPDMELDEDIHCVVAGFDPDINLTKILKAANYLRTPDCLFVACNEDSKCPASNASLIIPEAGAMVEAIKCASEREPVVVGQPQVYMFDLMKKMFNIHPKKTIIIGDTLETDIAFAKNCGIKSLLVLTGNTSQEDLDRQKQEAEVDEDKTPIEADYTVNNLVHLAELLAPEPPAEEDVEGEEKEDVEEEVKEDN